MFRFLSSHISLVQIFGNKLLFIYCFQVDKIMDSKRIKGKLHYLIRWKGYSASSDTWEPENTLSCPDLINKFNEEVSV